MRIRSKKTGMIGTRGDNELALTGPAQGVYSVTWDDGQEEFVRDGNYDVLHEGE